MNWSLIIGYLASICMVGGYLPQAITTIRTRDTDGIAMPTFLSMGVGSVFFVIQGIMIDNLPLVITNVITATCCAIITVIKLRNDATKRKLKNQ
jgi:MtN3 and saliva related transmembrane protein